jgi:hypothetical protein
MERYARGVTIRMGGVSYIAEYPMSGADVKRTAIPGTMSLALRLGRVIREAGEQQREPFQALIEFFSGTIYEHARVLLEGKVVDIERRSADGFVRGTATIATFDGATTVELTFQNEHPSPRRLSATASGCGSWPCPHRRSCAPPRRWTCSVREPSGSTATGRRWRTSHRCRPLDRQERTCSRRPIRSA